MTSSGTDLLLFDTHAGGHTAEYIGHLLDTWRCSGRPGRALAVGPAAILGYQEALWERALDSPHTAFAPLPSAPAPPGTSVYHSDRWLAKLLRETIAAHRPRHVVLMRLDLVLISLALGLRLDHPVGMSGILFRPTLHRSTAGLPLAKRVRHWQKAALLRAVSRNPHLEAVFSLDASAVPALRRIGLDAYALPDPVDAPSPTASAAEVRARFGIEDGRRLVVLFGLLDDRKNILPLLDALALLPEATAHRTAVLLAGPLADDLRTALPERIAAERRAQVVCHDAFVPFGEGQTLLAAADLVWAVYDGHVGSSAVLIRAAAAGRPVLSQTDGLMGDATRLHSLGRTVEGSDPATLARALDAALADPAAGFDLAKAAAFAETHTPEAFARTILDRVAPTGPGEAEERG